MAYAKLHIAANVGCNNETGASLNTFAAQNEPPNVLFGGHDFRFYPRPYKSSQNKGAIGFKAS